MQGRVSQAGARVDEGAVAQEKVANIILAVSCRSVERREPVGIAHADREAARRALLQRGTALALAQRVAFAPRVRVAAVVFRQAQPILDQLNVAVLNGLVQQLDVPLAGLGAPGRLSRGVRRNERLLWVHAAKVFVLGLGRTRILAGAVAGRASPRRDGYEKGRQR